MKRFELVYIIIHYMYEQLHWYKNWAEICKHFILMEAGGGGGGEESIHNNEFIGLITL